MIKVMYWLTEDENPAIKYRTMIEICDKKPEDYQDCYTKIWEQKQIVKILSKQEDNGLWSIKGIRDISSVRYLTTFAEYGLCKDERLDRYVDYIGRTHIRPSVDGPRWVLPKMWFDDQNAVSYFTKNVENPVF